MSLNVRTSATALLATAAVTGCLLATAAPAQAAPTTQCRTSTKTSALPGKPDVKVSATVCIKRTKAGTNRAYTVWLSKVSWDGTSGFIGGKRFNSLDFLARAKHGRTVIDNCSSNICEERNVTSEISDREKGSKTFQPGDYGAVYISAKVPNWVGDGLITYDVADDGKPTKEWDIADTRPLY